MVLLVTGDKDIGPYYLTELLILRELKAGGIEYVYGNPDIKILVGDSEQGADAHATRFAENNELSIMKYAKDTDTYGAVAAEIRNRKMVDFLWVSENRKALIIRDSETCDDNVLVKDLEKYSIPYGQIFSESDDWGNDPIFPKDMDTLKNILHMTEGITDDEVLDSFIYDNIYTLCGLTVDYGIDFTAGVGTVQHNIRSIIEQNVYDDN